MSSKSTILVRIGGDEEGYIVAIIYPRTNGELYALLREIFNIKVNFELLLIYAFIDIPLILNEDGSETIPIKYICYFNIVFTDYPDIFGPTRNYTLDLAKTCNISLLFEFNPIHNGVIVYQRYGQRVTTSLNIPRFTHLKFSYRITKAFLKHENGAFTEISFIYDTKESLTFTLPNIARGIEGQTSQIYIKQHYNLIPTDLIVYYTYIPSFYDADYVFPQQ